MDVGTLRPNTVKVDLTAIADNVATLRTVVDTQTKIFAALKGNGYGLGTVEVAREVTVAGVDGLAMVEPADALAIRAAGIETPILLYPGVIIDRDLIELARRHRLIITIVDELSARAADSWSTGSVPVFVKVDVGMERFGARSATAATLVELVNKLGNLELAGVYTHMHAAEPAVAYFAWQTQRFQHVLTELADRAIDVPLAMAASSPSLSILGGPLFDAIDTGHLIYGMRVPLAETGSTGFRQALVSVQTRIVQCKPIERTEFLEQAPFPVRPEMRIAILPIGRADGLKSFTAGEVLVRGQRAGIIGKPSLEHCRIDVTDITGASVGDEVTIIGEQDGQTITIQEVCRATGLDEVGVITSIARPIRRVYTRTARGG